MNKKTKLRLSALGAILAVGLTVVSGATVANAADPTSFKQLNGVGSDTTQDVVRAIAATTTTLGSYDAAGTGLSATIQTTASGPSFNRPIGSGAGVKALSASANGTVYGGSATPITGQVDFARSSSGPAAGSGLTYIPFATDAVSYAVNSASDFPRNIKLGSASDADNKVTLRNIYRCTVTSYRNADGDTVAITPLLPQTGSGTRSFFLGKLGLTDATTCATTRNNTIIENDGTVLSGPGDIVPFSIGQFIAQSNAPVTGSQDHRAFAELGKIEGAKPTVLTADGVTLNATFPLVRTVYNVVQTSRLTEPAIAAAFVGTSSSFCANPAIIRTYGFATLNSGCGATTLTGAFQ